MSSTSLFAGCADYQIRYWKPSTHSDCDTLANMELSGDAAAAAAGVQQPLFDVDPQSGQEHVLRGHIGPVSALSLTEDALYSGSWDYTVRTWKKRDDAETPWKCVGLLKFDQWVLSMVARGRQLYVAAGSEVLVHDAETYQVVRRVSGR